jgi:DedD protein
VIVSDLAAPKAPGAEGVSSTNAAELPVPRTANSESGKSAAPSSAHAATEAARTASASHPSAQRDGFAVQLAAFADDKGANSLAGRLKKAGSAAYPEPLKTSKGTLWRVRVGPYPSREAAIAARDKLKTEGQSGIVAAIK